MECTRSQAARSLGRRTEPRGVATRRQWPLVGRPTLPGLRPYRCAGVSRRQNFPATPESSGPAEMPQRRRAASFERPPFDGGRNGRPRSSVAGGHSCLREVLQAFLGPLVPAGRDHYGGHVGPFSGQFSPKGIHGRTHPVFAQVPTGSVRRAPPHSSAQSRDSLAILRGSIGYVSRSRRLGAGRMSGIVSVAETTWGDARGAQAA